MNSPRLAVRYHPPVEPSFHVKLVSGRFVTVLPYLQPVVAPEPMRQQRRSLHIEYNGPSLFEYALTKMDHSA